MFAFVFDIIKRIYVQVTVGNAVMKKVLLMVCLMVPFYGQAQVYKCTYADGAPHYMFEPCEPGMELKTDDMPTHKVDYDMSGVRLYMTESDAVDAFMSSLSLEKTEVKSSSLHEHTADPLRDKNIKMYYAVVDNVYYSFKVFPDMDNSESEERIVGVIKARFNASRSQDYQREYDKIQSFYLKKYGEPSQIYGGIVQLYDENKLLSLVKTRKPELFWCKGYETDKGANRGYVCPLKGNDPVVTLDDNSLQIYDPRYFDLDEPKHRKEK